MADTRSDLQKTQKAMEPGPKASLVFSFFPFHNPSSASGETASPVKEVDLLADSVGMAHVEFTVLNLTSVDALNAQIVLLLCGQCQFAKEPEGFRKVPGQPDNQREIEFPQIAAVSGTPKLSTDILVPSWGKVVYIGIQYRCQNCIVEDDSRGTIHIRRDFVNSRFNKF